MKKIIILILFSNLSICFAQIDTTIYLITDTLPKFKYGNGLCTEDCLFQYIYDNFQFPQTECVGTVYVQFVINKNGEISNEKILRGICEDFDNEAIRLIKNMPNWIPGEINGENVRSYFVIPVNAFVYIDTLNGFDLYSIKYKDFVFLHQAKINQSTIIFQNRSIYFREILTLNNDNSFTFTEQELKKKLYFISGKYEINKSNELKFVVDTIETKKLIDDFNTTKNVWFYIFGENKLMEDKIYLEDGNIILEDKFSNNTTIKTELIKQ